MRKILMLLLCFSFLYANATNVSGGIYSNTTWTAAGSPYIVTGNIVVFETYTLTIDPGVQVLVDSGLYIEIRGWVRINGTASNKVVIKGNTSTNNWIYWEGIRLYGSGSTNDTVVSIKHCNLSNAEYALYNVHAGKSIINNCNFKYNYYSSRYGGPYFDSCTFKKCKIAVDYAYKVRYCAFDSNEVGLSRGGFAEYSKFTNHTKHAIGVSGNYSTGPVHEVLHCEITDNHIGFQSLGIGGLGEYKYNTISNNDTAIVLYACETGSYFLYNKICNNHYNIVHEGPADCNLKHNCWCTMDSTIARSKVYDGYNDITVGLLSLMPMDSVCTPTTGIPYTPVKNAIALNVYPNPSKGTFTVSLNNTYKNATLTVLDMTGRVVTTKQMNAATETITMGNAAKGVYTIRVVTDKKVINKRIVIE